MKKTDVIEKLMQFNLSRPEAIVYMCLWEHGELTGYEASKLTGISRSNVYGALNVLADKGAAVIIESGTTLYSAVNPEEFLANKIRHLEEDRQYIIDNMPKNIVNVDSYTTIQGYRNIKDKIRYMITHCDMRLYFASNGDIIRQFEDELIKAKEKGLKIVIMSNRDFSYLSTQFYDDDVEDGQVRLITDSTYVLTGELHGKTNDTCLYSGQKNLVTIMKEALRNKIRLLELEGEA
ncbi:MAG: TrmB family transcriptional regulator [Lachnospiraceae bacterium]|nr:TrmB family transcriptional regulator [Lachnospiraceae bacterium]